MFNAINVSTSGLIAQRQRMNTIASNIANIGTTRNAEGKTEPYQRRKITFSAEMDALRSGQASIPVRGQVELDEESQPRPVLDPGHPDANAEGIVLYPGIQMVEEFTNAIAASRAYEANVTTMNMSKRMAEMALRLLG